MATETIVVEVAYATPERQVIMPLELPQGCTAIQAVTASGIDQQYLEIDLSRQKIGIFGLVCKPDTLLTDGDRVEIYRPLRQNPMEARRGRLNK